MRRIRIKRRFRNKRKLEKVQKLFERHGYEVDFIPVLDYKYFVLRFRKRIDPKKPYYLLGSIGPSGNLDLDTVRGPGGVEFEEKRIKILEEVVKLAKRARKIIRS